MNKNTDIEHRLNIIKEAYTTDAIGLSSVIKKGFLQEAINDFNTYSDYIQNKHKRNNKKLLKSIFKSSDFLDPGKNIDKLRKMFHYAHIAACCELFKDWSLTEKKLTEEGIKDIIKTAFNKISDEKLHTLETRVHISDTIRTCQILRLLGIFNKKSESIRQISLAAGPGTRDIQGLHATPKLTSTQNIQLNTHAIKFNNHYTDPELVILIDNSPEYKDLYSRLNNQSPESILALNEDSNDAFEKLPKILSKNKWKPINVIAGFRIDHRMIPDISDFFSRLVPILDDISDLIITIGAGHTLDEFIGRKKVINDLYLYLKKQNLEPKIITLHSGNTPEEQRSKPYFGYSPYTTYEILYCKLIKKKLKRPY